jgi:hypothetical protein
MTDTSLLTEQGSRVGLRVVPSSRGKVGVYAYDLLGDPETPILSLDANLNDRGATLEATAEKESETTADRLAQLQARHAEVACRVSSDVATEDEILEAEELRARVMAASQAHDAAQMRAYREAIAAQVADFDTRVNANMTTIGGLVAQLLFALQDTESLVADAYTGVGNGREFEDMFGVPEAVARDVRRAISEAAPAAQWNYDVCAGGTPQRPVRTVYALRLPPAQVRDVHGNRIVGNRYI